MPSVSHNRVEMFAGMFWPDVGRDVRRKQPFEKNEIKTMSKSAQRLMPVPVWPDAILFGTCLLLLVVQLFVPPLIGLANNGDFGKIMGRLHLVTDTNKNLIFFVSKYQHTQGGWDSQIPMSELLPARVAVAFARLWQKNQDFDIRFLAALHCCLFLIAFCGFLLLLWRFPLWVRLMLGGLTVWIFTDVAYSAYFNSFFGDTIAFLSGLLIIVLSLHIVKKEEAPWYLWLAFSGAALLFITSKSQHALGGIVLTLFPFWGLLRSRSKIRRLSGTILCIVLLIAMVSEIRATPSWYKSQALFDVVFINIPKTSIDHERELQELNLPADYATYFGANVFLLDRNWVLRLYRRLPYTKVAEFYLRHPLPTLSIMWGDLKTSATCLRPLPLANYRQEDGFPPGTLAHHSCSWSDMRGFMFRVWPSHIVFWYWLVILGAIWTIARPRGLFAKRVAAICLGVCVIALLEFAVASLGDGSDTRRHLFLFHALTDVTICFSGAALLSEISNALSTRGLGGVLLGRKS
jgi:hypothetical protein